MKVDPLGFRGYGEYAIRRLSGVWTWYNAVTGTNMARYLPEKEYLDYPFGRHTWNLTVSFMILGSNILKIQCKYSAIISANLIVNGVAEWRVTV